MAHFVTSICPLLVNNKALGLHDVGNISAYADGSPRSLSANACPHHFFLSNVLIYFYYIKFVNPRTTNFSIYPPVCPNMSNCRTLPAIFLVEK